MLGVNFGTALLAAVLKEKYKRYIEKIKKITINEEEQNMG